VASAWIRSRATTSGGVRHRVEYRLGGREAPTQFAGSFATKREATQRKVWVLNEIAAGRAPVLCLLVEEPPALTLTEAGERWKASRFDATEATLTQQWTSLKHGLRRYGDRAVDAITAHDVQELVAELVADGKKRGTIDKAVKALGMVFEHARVDPNPARDRVIIKLPRDESEEPDPPIAEHVAKVYSRIPAKHRLPLLWLDWSGARVSSVDLLLVGDYDQSRRRVRLRKQITKMRRALWVELHPVLAEAIESTLPHPRFRDLEARLFPESGGDAMRTAITKACASTGVPHWSPHDLRHRRISLLHLRGMPWARVGEWVGQRDLAVTANTYTHVLLDETELDYAELLAS
jgi:integrase